MQMWAKKEFIPPSQSLHKESNDKGLRLINFSTIPDLVIGSSMFPHKNIQKGTWRSSGGKTVYQIVHILINSRNRSNLLDIRSYMEDNVNSDHYLVVACLEDIISLEKNIRCNILKLRKDEFRASYVTDLQCRDRKYQKKVPLMRGGRTTVHQCI